MEDQLNNEMHTSIVDTHTGLIARLLSRIMAHPGVSDATRKALAAGIPWATIIGIVLPFVLSLLSGKPVDWQALIAAILALITPVAP